MPLGANILRQHIVEFISDATIGGVYTDGVRNTASTSGPWTWVVPAGVTLLRLDAIGGGCGGGAGWNTGTALAGGGGGNSGAGVIGMDVQVFPNATLTVTIGAGGSGGVSGGSGAAIGGRTSIAGLTRPYWWRRATYSSGTSGTIEFGSEYGGNGGAATATASGGGGTMGNNILGRSTAVTNAASGINATGYTWTGQSGDTSNIGDPNMYFGGRLWAQGGAAGGAANTTATSAGGTGGAMTVGGDLYNSQFTELGVNLNEGAGNTVNIAGTDYSRGGGGAGAHSFMAFGGKGGDGGSAGANGGIGAGGGGGGGGANGGSGGNGYVRFIYWSVD